MDEKVKKGEIQPNITDETVIVTEDEESIIQSCEESIAKEQEVVDSSGARINEFGEIIRENNIEERVIQDSNIGIDMPQKIATSKQFQQLQPIQKIQTTNMWKNRFQNWYSAIDRVSPNAKSKFLKMKADIVKVINNKIKERTNEKENDRQDEQDK